MINSTVKTSSLTQDRFYKEVSQDSRERSSIDACHDPAGRSASPLAWNHDHRERTGEWPRLRDLLLPRLRRRRGRRRVHREALGRSQHLQWPMPDHQGQRRVAQVPAEPAAPRVPAGREGVQRVGLLHAPSVRRRAHRRKTILAPLVSDGAFSI